MQSLRGFCAAVLVASLIGAPVWSAPAPSVTPLGTIITAERAHVGANLADVGTTVYGGDFLSTEAQGSVQMRAGAARLLLLGGSSAMVNNAEGSASAKLLSGTATFSTGNSRAFTLFASSAAIRPQTDSPTIGQVTYVSEKELLVTARRGGLTVSVEEETQVVAEGTSYRVLLDPTDGQGPAGAGSGQGPSGSGSGGGPLRAGRSRFLLLATAFIAAGTAVAIYFAYESADRP